MSKKVFAFLTIMVASWCFAFSGEDASAYTAGEQLCIDIQTEEVTYYKTDNDSGRTDPYGLATYHICTESVNSEGYITGKVTVEQTRGNGAVTAARMVAGDNNSGDSGKIIIEAPSGVDERNACPEPDIGLNPFRMCNRSLVPDKGNKEVGYQKTDKFSDFISRVYDTLRESYGAFETNWRKASVYDAIVNVGSDGQQYGGTIVYISRQFAVTTNDIYKTKQWENLTTLADLANTIISNTGQDRVICLKEQLRTLYQEEVDAGRMGSSVAKKYLHDSDNWEDWRDRLAKHYDKYLRQAIDEDNSEKTAEMNNKINTLNNLETVACPEEDTSTANVAGTSAVDDPCWNAGLDSEGWIICPTINNLKYTAGPLESMVEGWLTVETDLYNFDSPTHTVWEIMRNIANIFMIIFLLAIIFSQLTGYGIDNYGIKKMLPRLIMMAVLINLSFVICEVAVDLSNILGVGLRNMFGSIGETMLADRGLGSYLEGFVGNVVTWIFAAAGVAGAAAPTALAIAEVSGAGGTMVAVVIILALIVVVAALLLFFVMLGARMIIIIGCIAVAPIAFAAFTLPNTQSWFKKWWDVFKAALIMFPICGALGGISVLIKAIVLGSSGIHLWMLVVALIAPFLPFFLLPMLLRSAIGALGKVGGALTTMGQRFSGGMRGLSDSVRGSERFKEAAQYGRDMTAVRRAQSTRNRFGRRYGVDANGNINRAGMSERERDMLHRAEQTINADTARRAQNEVGTHMMDPELAAGVAQSNRDEQMVKDWETALTVGRVTDENGNAVNVNNMQQMADYHSQQLDAYARAAANNDVAGMAAAMAQIKATQNIMSKSSGGRDMIQTNITAAAQGGQTAGLQEAASHLMDNFGDVYKSKNRGSHEMLSDLASGKSVSDVANKVNNGSYAKAGTNKYDAATLVGADDAALDGIVSSLGNMSSAELTAIQTTANNALAQYHNGNLSIKPEVLTKIQDIANHPAPLPVPHP